MKKIIFLFVLSSPCYALDWVQELNAQIQKQEEMFYALEREEDDGHWGLERLQWRTQFSAGIDIPYVLNVSVIPEIEFSWAKKN